MLHRLRNLAAVLLKDRSRYRAALARPGSEYLALCNRGERLESAPDGSGYRCEWKWTSDLHAPKYLPRLGLDLMQRALEDHPMRLRREITPSSRPVVSFVIGHRGAERIPHLLLTLEAIAGQDDASVECIVVEQDQDPTLRNRLPDWVRYVHTPLPQADLPYCRAWAFNVGAEQAQSDILVLHDNDMLVPADYALNALRLVKQGFEAANLKRFVFYLGREHTLHIFKSHSALATRAPEAVVQNLEGGGSLVITRTAFEAIGGFDESFTGWGGEDVEFWERASTLRVWPYGFLPILHLWHQAQPGKHQRESDTLRLYYSLTNIPVDQRIARLREPAARPLSKAGAGGATL
jgi:hypothetical protein